jgi:hypothetical protein
VINNPGINAGVIEKPYMTGASAHHLYFLPDSNDFLKKLGENLFFNNWSHGLSNWSERLNNWSHGLSNW